MKEEWFISINMFIESLNVTNTNNLEGVLHASRIILVSNSSRESSNWNRDLYSYECSCWTNGDQEYHPSTTAPRYKSYESTIYYLPHSENTLDWMPWKEVESRARSAFWREDKLLEYSNWIHSTRPSSLTPLHQVIYPYSKDSEYIAYHLQKQGKWIDSKRWRRSHTLCYGCKYRESYCREQPRNEHSRGGRTCSMVLLCKQALR